MILGDFKHPVSGKIKCPRHFVLRPGANPYQVVPNPKMKNVPDWAFKRWPNLRKWIYKRDRHGNPVRNYNSYYQPDVSRAFAIEHIYDPKNPICKAQCRGRCLEGQGIVVERSIKRLS